MADNNVSAPPYHDDMQYDYNELPPPYTQVPIRDIQTNEVLPETAPTQAMTSHGFPAQRMSTQGFHDPGMRTQALSSIQGIPTQQFHTQGIPTKGFPTNGNLHSHGQGGPPRPTGTMILESHGVNPQHGFINPRPATNSQGQGRGIPRSQGQPQGFPSEDIRSSDHQPLPAPQVVQQDTIVRTVVVVAGQICPTCRRGIIRERLNVCMIVMAVLFFPLGLLFLLCAKEKVCNNCGATCG